MLDMLENNPRTGDVSKLIAEDGQIALRKKSAEVPECLHRIPDPSWVFVGKFAMPHAQHLIPFLN